MNGTTDIMMIHQDGAIHKFPSDCLCAANLHLAHFKEKLRAMHFGRTKTVFKAGKAVAQVEMTRDQIMEQL